MISVPMTIFQWCGFEEYSVSCNRLPDWSFAEKTFVKQSMMLCAFEILLKIGRFGGGVNCTW